MGNTIAFLVDGFNLYHSIVDLEKATGKNYRWLDIASLCGSFLSAIGNGATLGDVYYFSALAHHKEKKRPGTVARHEAFISALSSTGVKVQLGRFKAKDVSYICPSCGHFGTMVRHEEKETDVAIASTIVEVCLDPAVDAIAVLSGDTDLVPAMRTASRLSGKPTYVILPYGRYNNGFDQVVKARFSLREPRYATHQFPDPVSAAAGRINCPLQWKPPPTP